MTQASKKIFPVKRESQARDLLTEEQGRRLYEQSRIELRDLPCPGLLVLDFSKIQHITLTCMHQILQIFHQQSRKEFASKYLLIRLRNVNSDLKESLRVIAKEESLVLLCGDSSGNWEFLGHLTHALSVTLQVVQNLRRATSEQVGKKMGLRLSAASNRLRQLYKLGLIVREEESLPITGGRRFVYSFVPSYPFQE